MSFVSGLELGRSYYQECIRPIMLDAMPSNIRHAAGLIGPGSEILGYDNATSTDHDWYPRVLVFLPSDTNIEVLAKMNSIIAENQPDRFRGYPTGPKQSNDLRFCIVTTVTEFCTKYIERDLSNTLTAKDWLTISEHRLLCLTAGRVYHDGVGELTQMRNQLAYYPDDVWYYMISAQWAKFSEENVFVGRCGETGDELGSRVIAARMVKEAMRLCFLIERTYAPYSKWFGRAFSDLACSEQIMPLMADVLSQDNWQDREASLVKLCVTIAHRSNQLGISSDVSVKVTSYHNRPYQIMNSGDFSQDARSKITDAEVLGLKTDLGSVNQVTDMVRITETATISSKLKNIY